MRKLLIAAVLALAVAPTLVTADPIVERANCADTERPNCATGITGLEVFDLILDVAFVAGPSYNDVFGTEDPFFLGDEAGSREAALAILRAFGLEGSGIDRIFGAVGEGSFSFSDSSLILIPDRVNATGNLGEILLSGGSSSGEWRRASYSAPNAADFSRNEPDIFTAYAVFTERATTVPEPGTLALLGAGLLGMGFARRRKAA